MTDLLPRLLGPQCHEHGIRGQGNPEKGVMLLGISPGREETRTGRPMSGVSGRLGDAFLRACGWDRAWTYATNMVCFECREPTLEQMMECRPRLLAEVEQVKPKLVVLQGKWVTQQFFGDKTLGGKDGVRGIIDWYKPWGCYLLPMHHPASLLYGDAGKYVANDLARDFQKIREFFDYPPNPTVEFWPVTNLEEAQIIMDDLPTDRFVALDIETPFKDEDETAAVEDPIVCFSFSDGDKTWWFPGEFAGQLRWNMRVQWTFHNGPYDTISLARPVAQGGAGVLLPIVHDTMYMSACLDERGRVHGLKQNLRETEAIGFYEKAWGKGAKAVTRRVKLEGGGTRTEVVVSEWDARRKADPEGFMRYNATDACGTARLAHRYYRRLKAEKQERVYHELLLPAVNTYRHMQAHGLTVSWDRTRELLEAWVPLRDQKLADLQRMVRDLGGPEAINPNSYPQMSKFMYGTLRLPGGPSTAKDVIEGLAGEHPFIDSVIDYRHLEKALGTYVVGMWPARKPSTGRVHPWARLHGVVTGRVAYQNPAINTQPRAINPNPYLAKIKTLFVAAPGMVLLEADYKQAECWMAWAYCQDPLLLQDLQTGDLHRQTAAYINKCAPEAVTEYQRAKAKNTTFGMFYGIGAQKLAKQNNLTVHEASTYITEWRKRYTEYPKYAEAQFRQAVEKGAVTTFTGRVRRYPYVHDASIMTETTNFAIQATSHDCLMTSIVEAFPIVKDLGGCIVLDIHDSMLCEVRQDNWQEAAKRIRDVMTRPRFEGLPSLPVEFKVGPSWAEMHGVDL